MHKLKNNKMIIDHDDNNSNRFLNTNPSFSSSLLDQIYRSIDQGDTRSPEMRFYRETTTTTTTTTTKKKQSNKQKTETTTSDNKRRSNNKVIENYAVSIGTEKSSRRRRSRDEHVDQDSILFNSFSSASFSSDSCSSSGGFSSSDTESLYGTKSSRSSCFAPLRPKPVRTSTSLEQGNRKFHSFRHDSDVDLSVSIGDYDESALIKSKSRALKIYNNLKKVKQPISPGGRITSFLNSIFANSRKTRTSHEETATTTTKSYPTRRSRVFEQEDGAVLSNKLDQGSSNYCSSASSFSRSCLSKTSPSEREKLYNGVKRTVRFYPVNGIVDDDCKPCYHKKVGEFVEWDKKSSMKNTTAVEEVAREFLDEYRHNNNNNNNKKNLVVKDLNLAISDDDGDDDDEDTASCGSSDLFELDHLAVFGSGRYSEELPVYETTHVGTNRAIANGFIV